MYWLPKDWKCYLLTVVPLSRLGALFEEHVPRMPRLVKAYGMRTSELVSRLQVRRSKLLWRSGKESLLNHFLPLRRPERPLTVPE